jgi:hypothetical protein
MSMRTLVLIVACVAVDCGVFRLALFKPTCGDGIGFIGALGFANVLVLAGYRLAQRRGRRPFLTGFVVSGAAALALFLGACMFVPWSWWHPLDGLLGDAVVSFPPLRMLADSVDESPFAVEVFIAIAVAFFNAVVSTPLVLIAVTGGWLSLRSSRRGAA